MSLENQAPVDQVANPQSNSNEVEDEVEDESQQVAAVDKKVIEKVIEKMERTLKLKVNGKEVFETIDLNDEARLIKELQLSKASGEAFQKAASLEKQMQKQNADLDQFFKMLQENPLSILMNPELGLNAEEIATRILDAKIEEESKSPEQKSLEEARAKLAEYEKREKQLQKESEDAKHSKLRAEIESQVDKGIAESIVKSGLPDSEYIQDKYLQYLQIALDNGIDLEIEELTPIVKASYERDIQKMIGKMSDDELERFATPDRMKSIRNKRIQSLKAANAKAPIQTKVVETGSEVKVETKKRDPNFWKKFGDF